LDGLVHERLSRRARHRLRAAIDTPLTILAWVETGFGFLFLVLAFLQNGTRARTFGTLVVLIAFILVAIGAEFGVPWYFGTHLGLDNGFGG
jgi:hypothetical protein